MATGKTEAESVSLVRKALDLGVNFIDTAEGYGTEAIVGKALIDVPRDSVVLSTKISPGREDKRTTAAEFKVRTESCLQRLQTDYVDILHLHGVSPEEYSHAREELVPALLQLREEGKVRFLGITEVFASDTRHQMLQQALEEDCWDVIMPGFNFLNQSARERVFPQTEAKNIGVLCMFAVRRALSQPEALKALLQGLVKKGEMEADRYDQDNPLGFLLEDTAIKSIPDAAYRYCRYEPGIHVVLSGTGDPKHLEENVASLDAPPLSPEHIAILNRLFQGIDSVSGN
jgi:aryl-alcohol dehydrogenase-like predicted oxidoreductase